MRRRRYLTAVTVTGAVGLAGCSGGDDGGSGGCGPGPTAIGDVGPLDDEQVTVTGRIDSLQDNVGVEVILDDGTGKAEVNLGRRTESTPEVGDCLRVTGDTISTGTNEEADIQIAPAEDPEVVGDDDSSESG